MWKLLLNLVMKTKVYFPIYIKHVLVCRVSHTLPLVISIMCLPGNSAAFFDPTTVVGGMQVIGGILGQMNSVDEMASVGFALGDLLEDLGVETSSETEIEKSIKQIEELNKRARDLRWTTQDLKNGIEEDLIKANSVKSKISALRDMIAASKRIADIMDVRPRAGEKAASIQQIKINSMILVELQALRRSELLVRLGERRENAQREIFMQELREGKKSQKRGFP